MLIFHTVVDHILLAKALYFIAAITTVVTIAEILKNNGLATEKSE